MTSFIIDCPHCRARVAAKSEAVASRTGFDDEAHEPWGERMEIGVCPTCHAFLVARRTQTAFEDFDSEHDVWSEAVRVYPKPKRTFSSYRLPRVVSFSLEEGDRSLQVGAFTAASAMFGRALEAVCRHILEEHAVPGANQMMLAKGIEHLHRLKIIDDRLHDWSKVLHASRNFASHPQEGEIARDDADDLYAFATAIIEYVYDLTDKYNDFKAREEKRARRKIAQSTAIPVGKA